jgi:hypothetical protein
MQAAKVKKKKHSKACRSERCFQWSGIRRVVRCQIPHGVNDIRSEQFRSVPRTCGPPCGRLAVNASSSPFENAGGNSGRLTL